MSRPRPVVFDLDGTLIDSRGDIVAACNRVLVGAGRPALPEPVIARYVGDGARQLVARAFGLSPDSEAVTPHLEAFLDDYTANPAVHTRLMPGAALALMELRERPLAICTNKPRRTTEAVLAALGLTGPFQVVVAGGDTPEHKPAPGPLRRVAELLGSLPSELIMVGDGPQDIGAARAVGAIAVGVRGGIAQLDALVASGPDIVLDDLSQLAEFIRERRL